MIKSMDDEPDVSKPLPPAQATKLIKSVLDDGCFVVGSHAEAELKNDGLVKTDVYNVLRYGVINQPAEPGKHGDWCYRVQTATICVVVCFRSTTEIKVVTAWRKVGTRRA